MYPEVAGQAAGWLRRTFGQKFTTIIPIGVRATNAFIAEVIELAGLPASAAQKAGGSRLPWYSRSVDSTYLTGKRVFVFGDATHAIAVADVVSKELGMKVVGLGSYSREFGREVREAGARHGVEAIIGEDYLDVEKAIADSAPELVLGTQMERHVAKRLRVPCAVISAPVHVQDFPARYSPQMGFEGANVLFDTLVHPLMMGLEEHLIGMFRDDFEFRDGAAPSHLGMAETPAPQPQSAAVDVAVLERPAVQGVAWSIDAEKELRKIPFFVRAKARRNTEAYAIDRGIVRIDLETLYDAKAHYGR